jgi:hypothetical protein
VATNAVSYLQIDLMLPNSHPVCMEVAGGTR